MRFLLSIEAILNLRSEKMTFIAMEKRFIMISSLTFIAYLFKSIMVK